MRCFACLLACLLLRMDSSWRPIFFLSLFSRRRIFYGGVPRYNLIEAMYGVMAGKDFNPRCNISYRVQQP